MALEMGAQSQSTYLNVQRQEDRPAKGCPATQQGGPQQPAATRQVQGLAKVSARLGNIFLVVAAQLRPGHQERVWAKK